MCAPLPVDNIRFASQAEIDWLNQQLAQADFGAGDGLAPNASVGWMIEVGLGAKKIDR